MFNRIAWNKGKKSSEETRRKLSESHKGYKMPDSQKEKIRAKIKGIKRSPETLERDRIAQSNRSIEWRKRIAASKMGDRNGQFGKPSPNWQGGITPINAKVRNSKEYAVWRLSVFERDKFTCQGCGAKGGDLHAHHILAFSQFPAHRFDINNGLTLCPTCHKKTDNYAGKAVK